MAFAVRVTEEYVGLMGRYVAEGQSVVPGAPLVDIMTPEGIVETIVSDTWGIVGHIEGCRIHLQHVNCNDESFDDEEDAESEDEDEEDDGDDGESGQARGSSGGRSSVFPRGSLICHILTRTGYEAGTIKGLTPRPTTVMARRYRRVMGHTL